MTNLPDAVAKSICANCGKAIKRKKPGRVCCCPRCEEAIAKVLQITEETVAILDRLRTGPAHKGELQELCSQGRVPFRLGLLRCLGYELSIFENWFTLISEPMPLELLENRIRRYRTEVTEVACWQCGQPFMPKILLNTISVCVQCKPEFLKVHRLHQSCTPVNGNQVKRFSIDDVDEETLFNSYIQRLVVDITSGVPDRAYATLNELMNVMSKFKQPKKFTWKTSIFALPLPLRILNLMELAGFETIEKLYAATTHGLCDVRQVSQRTVKDIRDMLAPIARQLCKDEDLAMRRPHRSDALQTTK